MISASVTSLVSEDVWNAALSTLKRNRAFPRNSSPLLPAPLSHPLCRLRPDLLRNMGQK